MKRIRRLVPSVVVAFLVVAVSAMFLASARGMTRVRMLTYTDAAVEQFGVTGRGVVVGLLDRGIDWRNADFRNDDGTTRIAYIFDLLDDSGAHAANNSYGEGTVYTRQQIDAALATGSSLATRDAVGHGTATAGISTGNGLNLADRRYRGIAPEATIVVVKITGGAPAHDDQPAEAYGTAVDRLPLAIDFVRDKAHELGMPCVMLLNIGSQLGPTDGTSSLCRKIDATVGAGKPGIVFVTGPGDDGGSANRAGGTIAQGETGSIQVKKVSNDRLIVDLWYSNADRFDVTVHAPDGSSGPFQAPANESSSDYEVFADGTLTHLGSNVDYFEASDDKREIYFALTGPAGTYTLDLTGRSVSNGRFDATLNPGEFTLQGGNEFLTYAAPGSIWDGATALNNICPSDYVFRTTWTDIDGMSRSDTGAGAPGELWHGSSQGPTFDGRIGVDVCAPGNDLFTTLAPKSYYGTFRFNLVQDGNGFYTRQNAVSAAAPTVTGIIALMLEANPQLDASEVKELLRATARTDGFTGHTPNNAWGYGKVDAFGAVARSLTGSAPSITAVKVNLSTGALKISGTGFASTVHVYVDGIPFAAAPKLKNGKLTQKGQLTNGKTLAQYLQSGVQAAVVVRNDGAGAAEAFYTRK